MSPARCGPLETRSSLVMSSRTQVAIASIAFVTMALVILGRGVFFPTLSPPPLPEDDELKQLFDREYQVFEELRTLVAHRDGPVIMSNTRRGSVGITDEECDAILDGLLRIGAEELDKREGRDGMLEVGFRMAGHHGGPWGSSIWIEYLQAMPCPIVEETEPPGPQDYGSARYVPLNRDGWYIVRKW